MSVYTLGQLGTTQRGVCRARYASRGQALIMAVLIMFLLAGLAGLFIAMINQAMVQTVQAVDHAKLEEVAQAGLHHVESELLYSMDGADWRPNSGPDHANRGWIHQGDGFYKVDLSYGPTTAISGTHPFRENPLDRMLKIDVEARFALANLPDIDDPDNPDNAAYDLAYHNPKRFLTRKISAFMPIGLTDYVRWITNLSGSTEPAVLGSGLTVDPLKTVRDITVDANSATNQVAISAAVYSVYEGPVRCDGPLQRHVPGGSPGCDGGGGRALRV